MFACSPVYTHSLTLFVWLLSNHQGGGSRGVGVIRHAAHLSVGPRGALRGTLALFWPIARVNVKWGGAAGASHWHSCMFEWPFGKKKKRLHPWVLSYNKGWVCHSWQASQMSPPVAKVPHSQNVTHDWKITQNDNLLFCVWASGKIAACRDGSSFWCPDTQ